MTRPATSHTACPRTPRLQVVLMGVLFTLVGLIGTTSQVRGQETWKRTTEALESRRLFRLAQVYLEEQAERFEQDPVRLRDVLIQQVHIQSLWALDAEGELRRERFRDAHFRADQAIERLNDEQSRLLFQTQHGLTWLSEAQSLREEDQWAAKEEAQRQQAALEALRRAAGLFAEVEKEIPEKLRDPNTTWLDDWSEDRWLNLLRSVRFQRAIAASERAYWYRSTDRLNYVEALQSALSDLDDVSRQVSQDDPLWWQVQLSRVKTSGQLEDWETAKKLLTAAKVSEAPLAWQPKLVAEAIRIEAALGNDESADQIAAKALSETRWREPELLLAVTQRLLARYESTQEPAYQSQAAALAKAVEDEFGSYWGRRANRLLIEAAAATGSPAASLEVMIRVADETFLKGEYVEALATYDKVIALAQKQQRSGQLLEITARSAALLQQLKRYAEAAERFSTAARLAAGDSAARYDWLAVANLQEAVRRGAPELQDDLNRRLAEMIETYPKTTYADRARLALAAGFYQAGRWQEVVDTLLNVEPDSDEFLNAVQILDLTRQAVLASQEASDVQPLLSKWALQLRPWLWDNAGQIRQDLPEKRLVVAQLWSRLIDLGRLDQRQAAADVLLAGLAKVGVATEPTSQEAIQRLLIVLAGLPARHGQAKPYLDQLAQGDMASMLATLAQLRDTAATLDVAARRQVGEWQLELHKTIQPTAAGSDPSVQRELGMLQAWAQLQVGEPGEAVDTALAWAKRAPEEGRLQVDVARLISASGKKHRHAALDQWRRVAAKARPRSELWCQAKYWMVRLTFEDGERDRARQLLKFLQATPPGWTEWPNADDFDRLAREVGGVESD